VSRLGFIVDLPAPSVRKRLAKKDAVRVLPAYSHLLDALGVDPSDQGDYVPRDRWPRDFRGLPNLYRARLPEGWRVVYTIVRIERNDPDAHLYVLLVGTHKEYDRLFGY